MQKIFSTKGRINRKTYQIYCIVFALLGVLGGISEVYGQDISLQSKSFIFLLLCVGIVIYIGHCSTVKRLHDLDRPASDIWQLNRSWTLQYRLLLEEGTHGKNQYGYPQS